VVFKSLDVRFDEFQKGCVIRGAKKRHVHVGVGLGVGLGVVVRVRVCAQYDVLMVEIQYNLSNVRGH